MSAIMQVLALPGFCRLEKVPPASQAFYNANTKPRWVAVKEDAYGVIVDGVGATMEEACADLLANHEPPIPVAKPEPTAADIACGHILHRVQTDPDFAQLMWHTEGFRRLCEANAAFTGKTVEEVEAQRKETSFRGKERRYFNEQEWRHRLFSSEPADATARACCGEFETGSDQHGNECSEAIEDDPC